MINKSIIKTLNIKKMKAITIREFGTKAFNAPAHYNWSEKQKS